MMPSEKYSWLIASLPEDSERSELDLNYAVELTLDEYLLVRNSLIDKDLIAFDGSRFQVLSLPTTPIVPTRRPQVTPEDFEDHAPATIRHIIRSSLDRRR